MSSCCRPGDYDKVFDEKRARSKARAYARSGLGGHERHMVEFARHRMSPGFTVLEIGGGIGEIQLELLRGGAARALNVELATQYERVASELIRERGLEGRVERRIGDFVHEADRVPEADVVVMNRVVCCYPDADRLVRAAAAHARRYLLITLPVDRWWTRVALRVGNAYFALRRSTFRGYVHATDLVVAAAIHEGLRRAEHRRGLIWQLIALERIA